MSGIQGLRGSGTFSEVFRPRNYRELFTLLEPNGTAPLNALLSMTSSEETDDPEFRNFRDELPERRMTIDMAGGAAAGVTALTLTTSDTNRYAIAGAILVNSRTGEVMRVTADNTATALTVQRNVGGTSLAINQSDVLFVAGYAAQEGQATAPTAISFDAVMAFNYTQIFRTSYALTNSMGSTSLRTGDKEDEMQVKALKLHMSDIERAMFFGRKSIDNGSTAQPTRYTGGLLTELSNVIDIATHTVAGQMTEAQFDEYLIRNIFRFGATEKIAFCGDLAVSNLQRMGKSRWQPTVIEGTYGVKLVRYTTYAGDILVHLHPQFRQIPNMHNAMVLIDFPHLKYRYLKGRDTQLLKDRQAPSADSKQHEYLTECGLELLQDRVHTVIRNWNTVA
jgi:hypothetical protein